MRTDNTLDDPSKSTPTAEAMAAKYVWWKTPEQALNNEIHFLAMMMTYATLEDIRWMVSNYSAETLQGVIRNAPPGVFNGRSWAFWHLRLGISPIGELPQRRLPD